LKKLSFFYIGLFILLAYFNYQHLNIGFLSLHSLDEYAFHGSLVNMYDGLTSFDIKKIFSFYFYSYGFGFFFLNLLSVIPFLDSDNIQMSIYIPRIITSLFAIGSLYFIYKIALLYVDKYASILISFIMLSMPGFWRNSLWFHPDWMMTFFTVLSVYYFVRDDWKFKRNYWFAVFIIALSISTKIQAVTFFPFVFIYIFYNQIKNRNILGLSEQLIISAKSILLVITTFIITNPYILHPSGFKAFIGSFLANIESNATNHGTNLNVTISDKLSNAIDFYYLDSFIFVFIFIISIFSSFQIIRRNNKNSALPILAVYFVINVFYLFFMVNKDWQHYYLSIFMLSPLLFIIILLKLKNYKNLFLIFVILIQVTTHISEFQFVFTKGYNPEKEQMETKMIEKSNTLLDSLNSEVNSKTIILISAYQPFEFRKLGLEYKNIRIIYGPLLEELSDISKYKDKSRFNKIDFIILAKDDIYFDKINLQNSSDTESYEGAVDIINEFNLSSDIGFEIFKENKYYYIWKKYNDAFDNNPLL